MDSIEKSLFDDVVDAIKNKKIDVSQVMTLITYVMITIETYKQLHGDDKLRRVIKVLKEIVSTSGEEIGLSAEVVKTLKQLLENEQIIIGMINSIVDASKRINVGVQDAVANGKGGCFGCF